MELHNLKSKSVGSFYFIDETIPENRSLLGSCTSLRSSISKTSSDRPEKFTKYNKSCIIRSEVSKPIPYPRNSTAKPLLSSNLFANLWKFIQILSTFLLALILFPILGLILFIIILPTKLLISCAIWLDSLGKMKILSAIRSFRASGSEFYTVVHVIRGECDMEKIQIRIEQAVNSTQGDNFKLKFPNLRKRLVKRLGFYFFQEKWEDFSITHHVRYFDDCGLSDENGLSQFTLFYLLQDDFESSYFMQDESIPQWEVLVVPKFYYKLSEENILRADDDRKFYAVVYRANAAVLDKKTALSIFQDDIVEDDTCTEYITRLSKTFTVIQKLALLVTSIFLGPWFLFKTIWKNPRPLGSFKKPGENSSDSIPRFLLKSSCPMNILSISGIKDLTRTTVTSALTSFAGTAARNMILGYNLDLPDEFWVTLRGFVNDKGQESICSVDLKSEKFGLPMDRLHDAYYKVGTGSAKFVLDVEKHCNLMGFWVAGLFPWKVGREIYKWIHRTNIIIEIWPGVSEPYTVFGNDLVADVFGWVSIAGTTADFGVTITSYAGRMRANFTADNEALGYHTNRSALVNEFTEEYLKISEICSLRPANLIRPGPC